MLMVVGILHARHNTDAHVVCIKKHFDMNAVTSSTMTSTCQELGLNLGDPSHSTLKQQALHTVAGFVVEGLGVTLID